MKGLIEKYPELWQIPVVIIDNQAEQSYIKNKSGSRAKKNNAGMDWDVKTWLLSCITKAEKVLGYEPQMKFEGGLKETHRWFVENWENIEMSAEF